MLATQMEGALQHRDKRVRTAAIQHLAEILVKDSDAAEELLAAISTAVQQQREPVQQRVWMWKPRRLCDLSWRRLWQRLWRRTSYIVSRGSFSKK